VALFHGAAQTAPAPFSAGGTLGVSGRSARRQGKPHADNRRAVNQQQTMTAAVVLAQGA